MAFEVLLNWPNTGLLQEAWDVSTSLRPSRELNSWFDQLSIECDWEAEGRTGAYLNGADNRPVHYRKDSGVRFFFDDPKQAMLFKLTWA